MTTNTFFTLVTSRGIYGTIPVNIRILGQVYGTFQAFFLIVIQCLNFFKQTNGDTHYHIKYTFFKRKAFSKSLTPTVLDGTDPKLLADMSE